MVSNEVLHLWELTDMYGEAEYDCDWNGCWIPLKGFTTAKNVVEETN